MIPILYDRTETAFASNGLGRLADCISCLATEERNGIYEVEFEYPVTGVHFSDIELGRIIAVVHDDNGDIQPFDIYQKTEPINGVVTFNARHISYRLSEHVTAPYTANAVGAALGGLVTHSYLTCPFTFATDKTAAADFSIKAPTTIRAALGGVDGSILDVYGGEYQFDKFVVNLWARRGQDTGVQIRYGSNLAEYDDETDTGEVYNAVVPYWLGAVGNSGTEQVIVGGVVDSGHPVTSGRTVLVPMDLSSEFLSAPTAAQLNASAASHLAAGDAWKPAENLTLTFIPLWQTGEYAELAQAQHLNLCDTADIYFDAYNKHARMKVVRVVYNVLTERYDEIELGELQTTLAEAITASLEEKTDKQGEEITAVGRVAGNTAQHFWYTGNGTDTGAHITEVDQATFESDRANGGPNLLARSNGIAVRNGMTELATFTANGATIGALNTSHIVTSASGLEVFDDGGASVADFGANARIGTTAGGNLLATSSALIARNGTTNVATFGTNGVDVLNSSGVSVASFGSTLRLGSTTNISGDDETPSSYLQIEEVAGIGTALKFMGTVGSHGMGRIDAHNYVTPDDDYREFRIIGPYGGENSPKIIFDYDGSSAARGIDIWLSDTKRIYISNTGATVMAGAFFFDTAVEAPAFKSNTHVHTTAGAIGEYKTATNSAAVSLATGAPGALASISLTAGTWVVVCHGRFASNATGYRRLNISPTSGASDQNVSAHAVSGNATDMNFTRILRPTATTTYYLNGWQNSGSAMSMPASQQIIWAVRIA